MQKISGLVIDPGDDYDGVVIRSIYPNRVDVPELVKQADIRGVDQQYRAELPDNLFALVLQDEDVTLRKFACIDAGNTALNVQYFMKTATKLPEVAQIKTAQNLCVACGWYALEVPSELQKLASGVSSAIIAGTMLPAALGKAREAKQNMGVVRASGGMVNPSLVGGTPPMVE